jgi:hypothetical protein
LATPLVWEHRFASSGGDDIEVEGGPAYLFLPPPGVDEAMVMRTTLPGLEVFPAPSTATIV